MALSVSRAEALRTVVERKKALAELEASIKTMPKDGGICESCARTYTKKELGGKTRRMCYCDFDESDESW